MLWTIVHFYMYNCTLWVIYYLQSSEMRNELLAQQYASRAAFFLPGFAIAAWAPLVPIVKLRTELDDAELGLMLLCLGLGALVAMPLAGAMAARYGCRRVLIIAVFMMAAILPQLAFVQTPWVLGALLLVFGMGNGVMDCAMNIQAVQIERDSGRPLMSSFHGFFSIGAFVGVSSMILMLSAGLSAELASLLAACVLLGLVARYGRSWRSDQIAQEGPILAWPKGSVVFIGCLCFITFLAEGVMLDWSAVFLSEVRMVSSSQAGLGYAIFTASMTTARMLGDDWVKRLGSARTMELGGVCAFAGLLIATVVPIWQLTLVGYALVGLGCANIVPILFSLAGRQKAISPSLAIPAVTTLGYAGVLAGPALIGFVAHASSLVLAFLIVGLAMLAVAISPRWLQFG